MHDIIVCVYIYLFPLHYPTRDYKEAKPVEQGVTIFTLQD